MHEVYGLESSTFHNETRYPVDPDYQSYPLVKTHLLPHEVDLGDPLFPVVYLLRDGRDCVVSMAHQRKDTIAPASNLDENMTEVIEAKNGSHFGGWGKHVEAWVDRADVVIRFEELIEDPIAQAEKLRALIDLPPPNRIICQDSKTFVPKSCLMVRAKGLDIPINSNLHSSKRIFVVAKSGVGKMKCPKRSTNCIGTIMEI